MRCPACKAENAVGPTCRRCKADLSLLFHLEAQRERLRMQAEWHAGRGEGEQAVALAIRMDDLRAGKDALRLECMGHLLQRDYARAWQQFRLLGQES